MSQGLPAPGHLAHEFATWLWWKSEMNAARFDLGDPVGVVDIWVDERLAFRHRDETRVAALMTGDSPSATLEARAALAGGKWVAELRVGVRRDDREFMITLKGPELHFAAVKLPVVVADGGAEVLWDRMHLLTEISWIVGAAYRQFAARRTASTWASEDLPAVRRWMAGEG